MVSPRKLPLEVVRSKVFRTGTKLVLVASIPGYLVAVFVSRELGFLQFLQVPIISASLLVAVGMLEGIERRLAAAERGSSRTYESHAEFYRALKHRVEHAERTVWTSYLRVYPPKTLGETANSYIESCRAWALGNEAHKFRRVIVAPGTAEELRAWVRDELHASAEAGKRSRHYSVRIIDWQLVDPQALSVALIDDAYVFIAFSGEQDEMVGFSIRDEQLAHHFRAYHQKLWQHARPVGAHELD